MALVARNLDPKSLGLWSMALAGQGYLLHLSEMGLRSVATAEAGREPGRWRDLIAPYLRLRLAASFLLVAAAGLTALALAPGAAALVVVVGLSLPMIALQLDWVALVEGKGRKAGVLLLVRPLAFLALLLVLPRPFGLIDVALAWTGAWALAAAATWPGLPRSGPHHCPEAGAPIAYKAMLRRGVPLMGVTFLNQAQAGFDLLLAGFVLAPEAAGKLYLAYAALTAALIPANAQGQLTLATIGRSGAGGLRPALVQDGRRLAHVCAGLGVGVAFLGPPLLPRLFGAPHAAAAPLLALLVPWLLLQGQTTLLQGALAGLGQQDRLLRRNLAAFAATLPLVLLAALSGRLELFALARILGEALRLYCLARLLPRPARRDWGGTLTLPAALLALAAALGSWAHAPRVGLEVGLARRHVAVQVERRAVVEVGALVDGDGAVAHVDQRVDRRFRRAGDVVGRGQVEGDLVVGAALGVERHALPDAGDRPVDVAEEEVVGPPRRGPNFRLRPAVQEPDRVHVRQAQGHRRVVLEQEHRPVGGGVAQGSTQVSQPVRAQPPGVRRAVLVQRVEGDDGGVGVDPRRLDEPVLVAVGRGKHVSKRRPPVVVAEHQHDRRAQPVQRRLEPPVGRRLAVVGEVAGDDHAVDLGVVPVDALNCRRQAVFWVHAKQGLAPWNEVDVGQDHEAHGFLPSGGRGPSPPRPAFDQGKRSSTSSTISSCTARMSSPRPTTTASMASWITWVIARPLSPG